MSIFKGRNKSKDFIYLRPYTDEFGNLFLRDQDGRILNGQIDLTVEAPMEGGVVLSVKLYAGKVPKGEHGASVYLNGKLHE